MRSRRDPERQAGCAAADWLRRVNQPARKKGFDALVRSMSKGHPHGEAVWRDTVRRDRLAAKLGIEYTLRDPGCPKVTDDK